MPNQGKKYEYKLAAALFMAAFLVGLDRFFKHLALSGVEKDLIGQFFGFDLAKNEYIAFSIPLGGTLLALLLGAIMIALIGYWLTLIKKKESLLVFPLTFLIISAISNIIDRIRYGAVIDYFDLEYFTIFNLSDLIIVLSVVLIIIMNFKWESKNLKPGMK